MFTALTNLAERRGRLVLGSAFVFLAVAGILGGSVASRLTAGGSPVEDPASPSVVARERLTQASGANPDVSVLALIRTGKPVSSPETRSEVEKVARVLASDPAMARVDTYYTTHSRTLVSLDGRQTFIAGHLKPVSAKEQVDAAKRIASELKHEPGVLLGGVDIGSKQINDQVQKDLAKAEAIGFPILFLLALLIFRGLVAALLPIGAGIVSILGTFLGLRIVNEFTSLSIYALNLVIAIGLGLAIDYSLFVVSRYREELLQRTPAEALRVTMSTAGRTVAFSSLTVGAALASLLIFPQPFLYSMGIGGILVALMSATVALVVLPATLAVLGPRVNALAPSRWKQASERTARAEAHGFWYRLAQTVMRRPGLIAAGTAAILILLGIPFLNAKYTGVDATALPKSATAHQVQTILDTEFPPNRTSPAYVAIQAPRSDAANVKAYAGKLAALPGAAAVEGPRYVGKDYWQVNVVSKAGTLDSRSLDLVRDIRRVDTPFRTYVGGDAAGLVDQENSLGSHLPYAIIVLAATTLILLFLMTGSLILPFKTLLMNLLTISGVFGVLVLIFQDGRLESVLGYTSQGALNLTQPLLIGAVTFALSTDYGVFLLTRIKEARDSGMPNEQAVAHGLERTGRIVTAAALLFCIAVGAFSTSKIVFIKEIGVGLVLGVVLDATLVRALLVPSLMKLLGDWNWWAPAPLRRVHERFGLHESDEPTRRPAVGH
jgi:uncharacterized membrane protein YdfJ with MMPL/SSD domain